MMIMSSRLLASAHRSTDDKPYTEAFTSVDVVLHAFSIFTIQPFLQAKARQKNSVQVEATGDEDLDAQRISSCSAEQSWRGAR